MSDELITIFGGSGFLGRHVVQKLARRGGRIRVAVRRPNLALFLKPLGDVGQIQIVQANVRDDRSVARAVDGADVVINLVGILCPHGRQRFDQLHVAGAERVAKAAAKAGARRLIHMSALGADENSESRYAATKAAGEKAVRQAFPKATIVRPSVIFGPDDDFFNRFALLARISPVLPLIGGLPVLNPGGRARFQPVYAGDVAAAMVAMIERPATAGKAYQLGGPRTYSLAEIYDIVLSETGRKRLCVSLPFGLAKMVAWWFELWFKMLSPNPPLTVDQVRQLKHDNVVAGDARGLADLGITPTPVEAIVPTYLWRHRRSGQFSRHQTG